MLLPNEKRVLWHPKQDNKFLVGGSSQITMYEWAPDYPEIRHVTSQQDLQFMKCFAWSPNHTIEDLVAVGFSTGRVDLMRLEATKHMRRDNILSNGPIVSLPVRNSRSCNALAFSSVEPSYLAVGLDKVRGDPSLVVWDIKSETPILSHSPSLSTGTAFPLRAQPQIPRADIGPRTDTRILQQHAPAEIVSSLAFLPKSSCLLLAGVSHRWLRLFDLRSSIPSTSNAAAKVTAIATDPFDPHRIATIGDGVATIWDSRKLPHPLLSFTEKDAAGDGSRVFSGTVYSTLEFSSTRRGVLATMERDAPCVRFWDTLQIHAYPELSESGQRSRGSSISNERVTKRSWPNLSWPASSSTVQSQVSLKKVDFASGPQLILSSTCRTKNFARPLASFALVPSRDSHPLTSKVLVVDREGDLELYAVHDTPKQLTWSSKGDLVISAGLNLRILSGFTNDDSQQEPWNIHSTIRHQIPSKSHSRSRSRSKSQTRGHPPHQDHNRTTSEATTEGGTDRSRSPVLDPISCFVPTGNNQASSGGIEETTGDTYSPAALRNYSYNPDPNNSGGSGEVSQMEVGDLPVTAASKASRGVKEKREKRGGRTLRLRSRDGRDLAARRQTLRIFGRIIADDISMVMRQRALQGYSLLNPRLNSVVTRDFTDQTTEPSHNLSNLWAWIVRSKELLCVPTSRLHGFDFQHEGILGIWQGLDVISERTEGRSATRQGLLDPSGADGKTARRSLSPADDLHGDYSAALAAISRRGYGKSAWTPTVSTVKVEQRKVALQLCGWPLDDEDLNNTITGWERKGELSKAACWLVFSHQYTKAVDLLMRSDDESHHMMSGALAALIPHGTSTSSKSPELRAHYEKLIVRLQDPYFRALLTNLAFGDWSEVLEEEALPFKERVTIALLFLDDKSLSSYLRRLSERSIAQGEIESLIVTGLTPPGINILQNYIDRTGDIQTGAILASYVCPSKFNDPRVAHWIESYRDLLDGFKLFHYRAEFDIERGQILQDAITNGDLAPFEWVPRQILIRCNYCNKAISSITTVVKESQATTCPNCGKTLPRCSVCLMTLGIVRDDARPAELARAQYSDTIDDEIVICQTCRHGGHATHIIDWFFGEESGRAHGMCAVADCDCRCADEF